MFTLIVGLMVPGAWAEPPMTTSVQDAVRDAALIVVATPIQVEFQTLKAGEVSKTNSHASFWIEYRVDRIIAGDQATPEQVIRVHTEGAGCEFYESEIRRTGDRFFETILGSDNAPRELDPAAWLAPTGATSMVLLLDVGPKGKLINHGFGPTPLPASTEHLATVEKLAAKKPNRPKSR